MRPAEALGGLALALCTAQAPAADPQQGKLLYETHCGACHYETWGRFVWEHAPTAAQEA